MTDDCHTEHITTTAWRFEHTPHPVERPSSAFPGRCAILVKRNFSFPIFSPDAKNCSHIFYLLPECWSPLILLSDRAVSARKVLVEQLGYSPSSSSRKDHVRQRMHTGTGSLSSHVVSHEEICRYSLFSSDLDSILYASELTQLDVFGKLFQAQGKVDLWWLDVVDPSKDELDILRSAFFIHPLTIEYILSRENHEKVELFKGYLFLYFGTLAQLGCQQDETLTQHELYLVIFKQGILSISYRPLPHAVDVRKKISQLRGCLPLSSSWICYALLYASMIPLELSDLTESHRNDVIDTFQQPVQSVEQMTSTLDSAVLTLRSRDSPSLLSYISTSRRSTAQLVHLLLPKIDAIKAMANLPLTTRIGFSNEFTLHLSDLLSRALTLLSTLDHCEETLSRSHSDYLLQLGVDSASRGSKVKTILVRLTLVGMVFALLNIVSGLWGMNVVVPGRDEQGLSWWFGIWAVAGAVVACTLCVAKSRKFL